MTLAQLSAQLVDLLAERPEYAHYAVLCEDGEFEVHGVWCGDAERNYPEVWLVSYDGTEG